MTDKSDVKKDTSSPPADQTRRPDSTESRQHAEKIIRNEESINVALKELDVLQAVMNGAANSHLVYLDRNFNFVRVNETYARTCGYRPEEMIGKNHFDLYPHAENEAIFARVRDTGEPAAFHDKPFEFPDQPERGVTYWDWTLTPVKTSEGLVTGLVFSLFETTERKRMEQILEKRVQERTVALEIMNEALRQSNIALEDFVHVAAHDLQEPLRKIMTFVDRVMIIDEDCLRDQSRDYLVRMTRAAARMQSLIRDLVKYARDTSHPDHFRTMNLKEPVEDAVKDLNTLLGETEGRIEIDDLPFVEADKVHMRRLFINLINNALKYHSGEKPLIRIYTSPLPDDKFHEIHVKDNGIGFEEQYLNKIFKPFQRLHGRKSPYPGTGMGLAICRKIVEHHGGTITARSEPGKGSTFIVRLPKHASPEIKG